MNILTLIVKFCSGLHSYSLTSHRFSFNTTELQINVKIKVLGEAHIYSVIHTIPFSLKTNIVRIRDSLKKILYFLLLHSHFNFKL